MLQGNVMENDFHTLKGYELSESKKMTYAMEDYLEMICRISQLKGFARVGELSQALNVRPSSVTKIATKMRSLSLIEFEKYGYIVPTAEGMKKGKYLIYRHEVLHNFLCFVNNSANELEQVEKIEHFLDVKTVKNIDKLVLKCKKYQQG